MMRRLRTLVSGLVMTSLLVVPGSAAAQTTEIVADTGGATLDLTLFGTPVQLGVVLDPLGQITEVTVGGETVTSDGTSKVRVMLGDDPATSAVVEVKAKKDKLKTQVRTATLADLVGPQSWSGNLFGSDVPTTVTFTVTDDGGVPGITDVAVGAISPADATYEVQGPYTEVDHDEAEAKAAVLFRWNGYVMKLKIEVEVEGDDDHLSKAKLKVELKGKDRQRLRNQLLADIAGQRTWQGRGCNGEAYEVTYTIGSADGSLTVDSATVDGVPVSNVEVHDHGFEVRFPNSKAKLEVSLRQNSDGTWDLKVDSKTTEKCRDDDDDDDDDEYRKRKDDDDDNYRKKDDDDEYRKKKDSDDDDDDRKKDDDDGDDD